MRQTSLTPVLLLATVVLLTQARTACAEDTEALPELPQWLEQKLEAIPEDKREILLSEKTLKFTGTWEKLFNRLEPKSSEEIIAYIDGMVEVNEAIRFNPETDMASIPLNTEAEDFNGWKTRMPKSLIRDREPGPI